MGGKKKHVELSTEGQTLQKTIREEEQKIAALDRELTSAQADYEQMFNSMTKKVNSIEGDIVKMEQDIINKKDEITEKTPIFNDLEEFFNKRSTEYDTMKKQIVALKNKKLGLDDSIKRAKKDRDGLKAPKEVLLTELKQHRSQVLEQIRKQSA